MYWLADIIGQYWANPDTLVSAYESPICADIKTVFMPGKNGWTSDLKRCSLRFVLNNYK